MSGTYLLTQEGSWGGVNQLLVKRILLILLGTAVLLTGLAVLSDATFRYPWFGVELLRDLSALEGEDSLAVMVSVDAGLEMVAEEDLHEEPSVQDSYTLLILMKEKLIQQKKSATVIYNVEQMESEQWAWQQARLDKLSIRSEVFPSQLPLNPQLTVPQPHELTRPTVWAPWLVTLWPKFPSGMQKAGRSSWSEQFSILESDPVTGEPFPVSLKLVYQLRNFQNTSEGVLANVFIVGTYGLGAESSENREVTGLYKGFVLVDPSTGRVTGGEYRTEQVVAVRQPGLPVVRKAVYQGVRFWRPKYMQKGLSPIVEAFQDDEVPRPHGLGELDSISIDEISEPPSTSGETP